MAPSWLSCAARVVASGLLDTISHALRTLYTITWDNGLFFVNLVAPKRRVDATWPPYVPRKESDSRSPCPALNALSNHGILPHDGRQMTFKQIEREVHKYYNFSPSFCYFVMSYLARVLRRDYDDTLDLSDICVHNGIEHDGSMTRYDTMIQPDQSVPAEPLIDEIIAASKDGKKLTTADCSRILSARFAHSKRTNGQFSLSTFHWFFGASNAATLLLILGGEIEDLKPFLLEERMPEGWKTKMRTRMGLTMTAFNMTTTKILLGIDPSWKKVRKTE